MFQNKVVIKLALLFTFMGAAVGSGTVFKLITESEPFLTTTSPKGTYTVRLTGRKDRPRIPFVSHQVLFSVSRDQKVILANKYIHSGDWLDPSFELSYPEHTWVRDDILHFQRKELFSEPQQESIVILNKTPQIVQYLRVTSVDTLLLFNIQPQSTTRLVVSTPRGDSRWINVEGEFLGGRHIEGRGVGFIFPEGKQGPFTYYIYIDENSFTIESSELEKYKEIE